MSKLAEAKAALSEHAFEKTRQLCREILNDASQAAEAWHLSGVSHAQEGSIEDAFECFEKATEVDQTRATYPYNLALAQRMLGNNEAAIESYRNAIARKDDFLEARSNLGSLLLEMDRATEAAECFRELLKRFPDSSESHYNLANVLQEQSSYDEACEHFRKAIELDPENSAARENLGRSYVDTNQPEKAMEVWQEWIEQEPVHAYPQHMLAAVTGENAPDRCTDDYIRQEFNEDFANSFDSQLSRLGYQSPQLVDEALQALPNRTDLSVLDAGCGTGLCAPILRPLSQHLVGVDLSQPMLEHARKRNDYDELLAAEITSYMLERPGQFDLIVSCDTLCYFGELREVLAAAVSGLKPDGVLIFTVEVMPTNETEAFILQPQGRYCHSEQYVRECLDELAVEILAGTRATIRQESGRPVEGLIVTIKLR